MLLIRGGASFFEGVLAPTEVGRETNAPTAPKRRRETPFHSQRGVSLQAPKKKSSALGTYKPSASRKSFWGFLGKPDLQVLACLWPLNVYYSLFQDFKGGFLFGHGQGPERKMYQYFHVSYKINETTQTISLQEKSNNSVQPFCPPPPPTPLHTGACSASCLIYRTRTVYIGWGVLHHELPGRHVAALRVADAILCPRTSAFPNFRCGMGPDPTTFALALRLVLF